MDNTKEKLVELIGQVQDEGCDYSNCLDRYDKPDYIENSTLADHLITNGVRLEDKQATSNGWIPVTERLPQEDEPLGVICKQVQVLLSDGFVTTGWCNRAHRVWFYLPYEQTKFIGHDYKKTPVIAWQPLAQPPKGE